MAISELLRQKAFLEAGGQEEGQRDIDKANNLFGNIQKQVANYIAMKKGSAEAKTAEGQNAPIIDNRKRYEDLKNARAKSPITRPEGPGIQQPLSQEDQFAVDQYNNPAAPRGDRFSLSDGVVPSVAQQANLTSINATDALTNKRATPTQGNDLYINPKTREISFEPAAGYYKVSANTATTIAAGETREQAAERARIEAENRQAEREGKKPLSGEASKVLSISQTLVPEVEKLKTIFQGNYKGALQGLLTGTDRELVKLVDNIADKVGRLRSGGAINKDEEDRFKRQVASLFDLPFGKESEAIAALDGIINEAKNVSGNIRPGSEGNQSATIEAPQVGSTFNGEKVINVKRIK